MRELLEAVRGEVSGDRAHESVRAIARFHRVQASPGYDEAAAWLLARLAAYGIQSEVDLAPGDGRTRYLGQLMPEGWECTRAVATLVDGDVKERLCDYDACRLSLILRSDSAHGTYPIVALEGDAGARPPGRGLEGAIVLTRDPARRTLETAVREGGAAGILTDGRRLVHPVRDAYEDPDQVAYTSFWWNGDEPRGWGFVVSPRVGARLRERLAAGAPLQLEVEIESRRFETKMPLVSGVLPGNVPGEVLVIAHLCHPQPSANDNASGAAAALEAVRTLAALRARGAVARDGRTVRFLWVPELTGTFAWLGRDPARARAIVAALNLDMVGEDQEQCGSTFLLEHPPSFGASFAEDLLGAIRLGSQDWVTSFSGPGHYSLVRMAEVPYSGGSDHAVLNDPAVGIPCPMLIQWPDRYYHSSHDTPDRCDPRSLALAARCAAAYAGHLASLGAPEGEALLARVARGARVRLLSVLDHAEPGREVERQRVRFRAALGSLARLGVASAAIERAIAEMEAFAAREAPVPAPAPPASDGRPRPARPERLQRAPVDFQRHMVSGLEKLSPAERAAFQSLEGGLADPIHLFELSWFVADGRRSLDDIARLVWIETGRFEPAAIEAFFAWTTRLGLSTLAT